MRPENVKKMHCKKTLTFHTIGRHVYLFKQNEQTISGMGPSGLAGNAAMPEILISQRQTICVCSARNVDFLRENSPEEIENV